MTDEQCLDPGTLDRIKGTPWRPSPHKAGHKTPTTINDEGDAQEEEEEVVAIDNEEIPEVKVPEPNASRSSAFSAGRGHSAKQRNE